MKGQVTLREALCQRVLQGTRLRFALTVADDIVSVTLEGDVGMMLRYPAIKRILQKQVCQYRANNRPLRGSLLPSMESKKPLMSRSSTQS